jgi:short-subunit dehydrogenase
MNFTLALVTGATSGIGLAACTMLAGKGIPLIISGRNAVELEGLKAKLSHLVKVESIRLDLSLIEDRQALTQMIHVHRPDLVINNAGLGLYGEALTHRTEEQANILEVNAKAVLEISLEAARTLISNKKNGVILNVSSAAALHSAPLMAVYAATKAFVNQFSQAFDMETKPYGVRICTLCPGMVATQFQSRAGGKLDKDQRMVMSPSFVAEQIWKQVNNHQTIRIIDWRYRFLAFFTSFLPNKWVANIIGQSIAKRIPKKHIIELTK